MFKLISKNNIVTLKWNHCTHVRRHSS